MKVLDPQSALLPTAEVYQFLQDNKPRRPDKKIGAYASVNVQQYNQVRQDLEMYIQTNTPYAAKQSYSADHMEDLVQKLKKYELTKTEVFSLISLGVGLHEATPPTAIEAEATGQDNANGDDLTRDQPGTGDGGQDDVEAEDEEPAETGLNRMLFGLIVEESDERFAGDEGEQRITEILDILKDASEATVKGDGEHVTNGNGRA